MTADGGLRGAVGTISAMRYPDEPTTPEQWQVIAWAAILLFLVAGGVGQYFAWHASPETAERARQLRHYSLAFWGLAAAVYAVKRGVEYFLG